MTLVFQAIKIATMLLSIVVLSRALEPRDFGLFAMVIAIVGVAEIFRDFGLSMAALQAKDVSQGQQSNLFWINLSIGCILALATYFAAWPIGAFYGEPQVTEIAHWMSLTFVLNGASTQFKVVVNRRLQFVRLSLIDVAPYALGLSGAIVAALAGWGVMALVTQQIVIAIMTLALALSFARWLPSLPTRTPMGGLVGFGWRIAVTQTVGYFTRNVDSIAIGQVWGPSTLGFYDRGFQIVMMPINQINAPLSRVAVPTLARVRDDAVRYADALRRTQFVTLYATASIFGLLAGMGDLVTRIVLGDGWGLTGLIVQILAIGAIFRALSQVCYWIYVSKGLASAQMKYFLIAQPALAVVVVGGVVWGAIGVASTYAIGLVVYWVVSLWWACRRAGLSAAPLFKDATRAIVVFTAPAVIGSWLVSHAIDDKVGPIFAVLGGLGAALALWSLSALAVPPIRRDLISMVRIARSAFARR
ncbi:hypothetical protein MTS1_02405 [Microbacterium sp. TS-1]|uniref:lipopolysaccharide biosynthesis protein n=1 Tax=Microbacterium sp. TS-1 TaxID=1344956 RepID=UPI00038F90A4|nr:hypothetical protein MTS1_02405 [Microbacterium sp. TS-1]